MPNEASGARTTPARDDRPRRLRTTAQQRAVDSRKSDRHLRLCSARPATLSPGRRRTICALGLGADDETPRAAPVVRCRRRLLRAPANRSRRGPARDRRCRAPPGRAGTRSTVSERVLDRSRRSWWPASACEYHARGASTRPRAPDVGRQHRRQHSNWPRKRRSGRPASAGRAALVRHSVD